MSKFIIEGKAKTRIVKEIKTIFSYKENLKTGLKSYLAKATKRDNVIELEKEKRLKFLVDCTAYNRVYS